MKTFGQNEDAAALLQRAHEQLQAQAAKISDEALRQSYMEEVSAHRALRALL